MKDQQINIEILSPPGDTIRETMEVKGISLERVADGLQLDLNETTTLLNGGLAIDTVLASRLAAIFGIPTSFWINREADYRKELSDAE